MQLAKRKLARFPTIPVHFHRTVDLGCMWLHPWIHIKLGLLEMTRESGAYLLGTRYLLQEVSFIRCKSSSVKKKVQVSRSKLD